MFIPLYVLFLCGLVGASLVTALVFAVRYKAFKREYESTLLEAQKYIFKDMRREIRETMIDRLNKDEHTDKKC